MVTSTPYYAQGNSQAEASNKVAIEIIEKMIKDKPRCWYETLSEVLWAYRNSKRTSIGTTPYRLTFGHDVVLPMELNVKSARVALQHNLIPADYNEAMLAELEDLDEVQKLALDHLMVHKAKVMKAYNKMVKFKSFAEGDMVWQTILPPGKVDRVYGKWSPTWKGPYLVHQVLHGGAYMLKDLDGGIHKRPINGRDILETVPIWMKVCELPMHARSGVSISKVVSNIAKPIYMEDIIQSRDKGLYVRVLAEMEVDGVFPKII
ncbi:uncharacterized protein LOC132306053 [Cornus florida]|uniref:uncharacterized protein LOC132306053 n=1 Tax=Cornus florida TaxID=4283 RepID=UPI00289895B8|nr:uncharacterized protein LOC132306053 [Cornus florida]